MLLSSAVITVVFIIVNAIITASRREAYLDPHVYCYDFSIASVFDHLMHCVKVRTWQLPLTPSYRLHAYHFTNQHATYQYYALRGYYVIYYYHPDSFFHF